MAIRRQISIAVVAMVVLSATTRTDAQTGNTYLVLPQSRTVSVSGNGVQLQDVQVSVVITEQVATTTMDVRLKNTTSRPSQGELLMPVPAEVVVRGFTFQGTGAEGTAQLLPKDEARKIYESIVRKYRDPALLEFAGYNLIRSSVFPIAPRGTQTLRIVYEHLLKSDGSRVDYVLPRSQSLEYRVPWKVSVRVQSRRPISTIYSPSHQLETRRHGPGDVRARIAAKAQLEPGAFRLSFLYEGEGVTASLLAYPSPEIGGGYFLLLAGLPVKPEGETRLKREITFVMDRSGSMNGEKLAQAKEAIRQVLAGLDDGERFNIIAYNDSVDLFSSRPVAKSAETIAAARKYVDSIRARGGTNLHDALLESLRQKPVGEVLPIVLFLTDGLPTVGQTSEVSIRNVALKANPFERRIFTFGVGVDVNTPLLERVASSTRAVATFVLPKEDVEVKVGQVFSRLVGPVLANPGLKATPTAGAISEPRILDVFPQQIPDLFEGDQLVVLGKYRGDAPLELRLTGNYMGTSRTFRFEFPLDNATTRNAFVSRLWASRKIAMLVDAIRQMGANGQPTATGAPPVDARVKELTDEILRLTTEFGILTEYTAFLAREGTDLTREEDVFDEAVLNFKRRAIRTRAGLSSVNQDINGQRQKSQLFLNNFNAYFDDKMKRVAITTVQQVDDRAFFYRDGNWVDGRLVNKNASPKRSIDFGSPEFNQLLSRLVAEGRQGTVSLKGNILLQVDGEPVLIKAPPKK